MNEEIKDEINEEVAEETVEEAAEETEVETESEDDLFEEEIETEETEDDVNFDYDDEGNIIIPGETEDDETEETTENSVETKEDTSAKDDKDARIAQLEKALNDRDLQLRETLKSLGLDEKDAIAALEKLAAEAEDKPLEEYRKEKAERIQKEEAAKLIKRQRYEEMTRADLAAINAMYPETKKYKSVEEFPNFAKFGKYRDLGLSPTEAYIATHPQGVISSAVDSAKQQVRNLNNGKSHLRSNVPVGSKDHSVTITQKQMAEYRDIFPNLSDKEIVALHKQTNKK